jgi:hypothetical protein
MSLKVIRWGHRETSSNRSGTRCQSADHGRPGDRREPVACRPGYPTARLGPYYLGANGDPARSEPGQRAAVAASLAPRSPTCSFLPQLGRSPAGADDGGRRRGVPGALGRTSPRRWRVGGLTAARGAGRETGPEGRTLGAVSFDGATRVAESGPGHSASQERSGRPGGVEKKLPETLATLLTPELVAGRPVRLMFQDEARFGRMVRPRRCWAPAPLRPVISNGYERQFVYVYGAVSPVQGELDWRLCREMNTVRMGEFLQ